MVGACTYQSHAARAFHNEEDEAAAGGGAVHDPSLVALVRTYPGCVDGFVWAMHMQALNTPFDRL